MAHCCTLILPYRSNSPSSDGPSAVIVPRPVVIHSCLLSSLLGCSWKDGCHTVWFALSKSRGKSNTDHGVMNPGEIINNLKRELEHVNSFKQPFSGLQFIDSNTSCMSNCMNENLFSKRQLLWGHNFVNNNNRNTFLLNSEKRIC